MLPFNKQPIVLIRHANDLQRIVMGFRGVMPKGDFLA
jgi:hypothetical protein